MNSKERINNAINFKQSDKLPVDIGGTITSGLHAKNIYELRQYYNLDKRGTPVKLIEPFLGLGEIDNDLAEIIGTDVKMLYGPGSVFFGFDFSVWKEWALGDGTPLLVPELFNTSLNSDGSLYQFPNGDKSAKPCAILPKDGYYFESVRRDSVIDINQLAPECNTEEFNIISDYALKFLANKAESIRNNTSFSIFFNTLMSSFGDLGMLPGMSLKNPGGIRDISQWYTALLTNKNYIKKIFEYQCNIAIENYKKIFDAIGNFINIVYVMLTDFGSQSGLAVSKEIYIELFKPFAKQVNEWIHRNTPWKTMVHSCGAVFELIPEFIDAGFDILNPIQTSAAGMLPLKIKKEYGRDIVLWGGGIDIQKILPFGTPEEIKKHIRENIEIFYKNGGYVFAAVNNIFPSVPVKNIIAMIETVNEFR